MTIIKTLTEDEVARMLGLIESLESSWGPHEKFGGSPLSRVNDSAGETIWLHYREDGNWRKPDEPSALELITVLESYRDMIMPHATFGRAYIHRLKPGKTVTRHKDVYHPAYFSVVKRHQVYFDIPEKCEIESGSLIMKNSVVLFDHSSFHSYTNNGDRDLIFIVFDLLPV